MTILDAPAPIRPGEELDLAKLGPYLRDRLGQPDGDVRVEQFPGGHSNLTYLVRMGGRELVLRRPPFGSKVRTAHDMGREHRVLSALWRPYPRAPKPALFCDDESVLGAKFYLMERVPGVILRRQLPAGLAIAPATAERLCEAFLDALVDLHALDYRAIGLADVGRPQGYVARQIDGWTRRYADSRTDDVPELEAVAGWLARNPPPESGASVIHNDYKYDNLVLDPADLTRIIAVLDWEMATVGDPLMDLGTTLSYWTEPGDPEELRGIHSVPTLLPGSYTRRRLVDRYVEKSGRDIADAAFYYCYGLFKTAVVLQQIYYRYRQGLTRDERFASLDRGVRALARQAARHAEQRTL